jgi:hypothetical protein
LRFVNVTCVYVWGMRGRIGVRVQGVGIHACVCAM